MKGEKLVKERKLLNCKVQPVPFFYFIFFSAYLCGSLVVCAYICLAAETLAPAALTETLAILQRCYSVGALDSNAHIHTRTLAQTHTAARAVSVIPSESFCEGESQTLS